MTEQWCLWEAAPAAEWWCGTNARARPHIREQGLAPTKTGSCASLRSWDAFICRF